ncbi:MAG: serine/threonine-protein kinase [Planctomycetes bacterium]|nr:serine/threonine-protein kinase [Planctomycetota bacterium]
MDSASVLARFEQERQSLAVMDHPGVARILDAGVTERGLPYLVMELVQGQRITDYCANAKLATRDRLNLFIKVCEAVQHAHQKGIIHRDIKPSNILVTLLDGHPEPKVIDFGIAKAITPGLSQRTLVTLEGQIVGTPAYMSPEQAGSAAGDIDTRTDIYSLGVLLYELLTGALPFEDSTLASGAIHEIQRIIREVDPPKPSTRVEKLLSTLEQPKAVVSQSRSAVEAQGTRSLLKQLRGDLDWVVMKALEKDRTRRYASAEALAEDVKRFLADDPVIAGPPSVGYRARKFIIRHKGGVLFATSIVILLAGGLAASLYLYDRAERQRALAVAEADKATTALAFIDEMFSSADPENAQGNAITVRELLASAPDKSTTLAKATPAAEALIRGTLGRALNQVGDLSAAEKNLRRALDLCIQTLGEDHVDTTTCKIAIAVTLLGQGRPQEAMPLLQQGLAARTKEFGKEHDETLKVLDFITIAQKDTGEYDKALATTRDILSAYERSKGPQHSDTISVRNGLADLLHQMGNLDEALRVIDGTITAANTSIGPDHPRTHEARSIRAAVLLDLRRNQEAVDELTGLVEARERVMGKNHFFTITTLDLLAKAKSYLRENDAAIAIARDVVARATITFGSDNPRTLRYMNNLAQRLHAANQLDEAGRLYVTIIERDEKLLGPTDMDTVTARNNFALFLIDSKKPAEAVPVLQRVVKDLQVTLEPSHWKVQAATAFLAEAIGKSGDHARSLDTFEKAYAGLVSALGSTHPQCVSCVQEAVNIAKASQNPEAIKKWSERMPSDPAK